MRSLLRLVVTDGTGKKADVPGYPVMGKTGTAEKAINGGYAQHRLISSFLSAFPANNPRYVMLIMFDEPQGSKATYGYATAGWNAAPVTARVVKRVAPLLGIQPEGELVAQNGMIHEAKLVTYEPGSGD
jgi:cell division protein FtsI (penicillin-binding protein 3)